MRRADLPRRMPWPRAVRRAGRLPLPCAVGRLRLLGAALLRHMAAGGEAGREGAGGALRHSLLVGVSARPALDRDKLIKSGADCVWGKPPPEMNATLRNELLELLMKKRKM